ncbi:hypothetical protein NUU61_000255 [Penicillium alfredii]|uniref:Something about silencing protein 4 domain-containing protein n=1 Tax=Penicillium alfredii TaxID=1506179 RepID=A0A9W9KQU3_9EURO|nr:uncharacterized protein NUU61_000255 [Penicillium alfredii]KAJ5114496.1 hypothetical protein NUU61_000255 [Penicillium alfredii]
MALLSRSSLRGSVRRPPDGHPDDGLTPPMKKPRTQPENGPSRRRRSSPDCLDTTVDNPPSAGQPRSAKPPVKPARPRASTRRTRRASSSSNNSVASSQLATDGTPRPNGNGSATARGTPGHQTPSVADLQHGARESPDPLDTISPAVTTPAVKLDTVTPSAAVDSATKPANPPATIRTTRRSDGRPTSAGDTAKADGTIATVGQSEEPVSMGGTRSSQKRKSDAVDSERPAPTRTPAERRSLRSTDGGSRCKSELVQYFHNYEQLISLEDPKPGKYGCSPYESNLMADINAGKEFLAASTTIALVDDLSEPLPLPSTPDPTPFGNPLQNLHNCEVITLPRAASSPSGAKSLSEETYFRSHRKFERQEKQLRNIERDRAQHEKQQVDRLLDELRGHDWLRVMGLTGVHDSEKKLYEPKRDLLIQELEALVNKFQVWKDEERRRKLAKDKPLPGPDTETESHAPSRKRSRPAEEPEMESSPAPGTDSQSTPDPNDVDAWAARQLHQEARSASVAKRRKSTSSSRKPKTDRDGDDEVIEPSAETKTTPKHKKNQPNSKPAPLAIEPLFIPDPPLPDKPFTSFYSQRQLRDSTIAASKGTRRGHRGSILAFGHPIPETKEQEFEPPFDILTPDAIQSSQRKRRRMNRLSRG